MSSETSGRLAIGGYDPVAYFRSRRPTPGAPDITHEWQGREWRFASAENRNAFAADPQAFAPQNDGACAFAAGFGKSGPDAPAGSPKVWSIVDGRLYLSSNRVARFLFRLIFAPRGRIVRVAAVLVVLFVVVVAGTMVFGEARLPTGEAPGATLAPGHRWQGPVETTAAGVAIQGYDPVAHFDQGAPQLGSAQWSAEWNGATWQFASDAHRQAFLAAPDKYAPQFGGHCAFASSLGLRVPGAPDQWSIIDGRLFFNANAVAKGLWRALPGGGSMAYANWPGDTGT